MRAFVQSLLATVIIALPAQGTANQHLSPSDGKVLTVEPAAPAGADACTEALAQVAAVYAWHVSSYLFCPTGLCFPLIEASGYALLLSTAYAITVCAF